MRPVTLRAPLELSGYDKALPPGRYFVETEELDGRAASMSRRYTRLLSLTRSSSGDGRVSGKRSWDLKIGAMHLALERGDIVMDDPAPRGGR
jgi:hypothetical protein